MRRGLVLVGSPTRLFASRSGDWSVCYELLSVSARDDYGAAGLSDARNRELTHNVNTDTVRTQRFSWKRMPLSH